MCLDVINQSWSPMYDLVNIFETFLPQLVSLIRGSPAARGEDEGRLCMWRVRQA